MTRSFTTLHQDMLSIWRAGVASVDSERLLSEYVQVDENTIRIGDHVVAANRVRKIFVVGAGKAGAGMTAGLEARFSPQLAQRFQLCGQVHVPEDCVASRRYVELVGTRPAGVNAPTEVGVEATRRMLAQVRSLQSNDLCLCLLSGGGSALLTAPVEQVGLKEKRELTEYLSSRGANIQQLNTVRKHLSEVKGGGLARACQAGQLFTLVISDVLGDPLDVIASGPTIPDTTHPQDALQVLVQFRAESVAPRAFNYLKQISERGTQEQPPRCHVHHLVIGNNAVAVDGAGLEAERRGYSALMKSATELEGPCEPAGRMLAQLAQRLVQDPRGPDCLILGGEPTVELAAAEIRGRGGRNQQLVLAALDECRNQGIGADQLRWHLLSAGTDGEDGPTDAAGAWLDPQVLAAQQATRLDPRDYLRRNDAYSFFEQTHGLFRTGPTHTNVCDLRVLVLDRVTSTGT